MLSIYDIAVIIFYFGFLLSIGWVTRKLISNTSDYFRGGGKMLWWMAGSSAFMTQFSAWSFTGAASEAYKNGPIILTIFFANAVGFFANYLYFAPKFRQMRVVTPLQAVKQRFGKPSEQFFTWLQIPVGTLNAGIWLMGLSVFISSVFGIDLRITIVVTGLIVLFNSTMGGSWAVSSSDFMQVLILMIIAITTAIFALIEVGGPTELITNFPADSLIGSNYNYGALIVAWIVLMFINQFFKCNHMIDASRYLNAKNTKNAKKAALLSTVLFVVGPILWFIPPMASRVLYPDLSVQFPQLQNPSEAAYVAVAAATLPKGMIGLLLAGMFAATISSMDSGLNRNAGLFTKNFYLSLVRPNATEREQMIVAKSITILLGLTIVGIAIYYSTLKDIGLFDLMIQIGALLGLPVAVPLLWGMVYKKTPDWSGWSTAVVALICSAIVKFVFNADWVNTTWDLDFTSREFRYTNQSIAVLVNTSIPSIWFLLTSYFYKDPEGKRKEEITEYWDNLATPVTDSGEITESDSKQGQILGTLSATYGAFVFLLCLVPNAIPGRIAYVLCGSALMILGYALYKSTRPGNVA